MATLDMLVNLFLALAPALAAIFILNARSYDRRPSPPVNSDARFPISLRRKSRKLSVSFLEIEEGQKHCFFLL